MRITGIHSLNSESATARLEELVQQLGRDYASDISGLNTSWHRGVLHFEFMVRGFHIEGKADVTDAEWRVEASIPPLLRPFERTISNRVQEVAQSAFKLRPL